MGHTVNPDRAYFRLQQQLDRTVTGAPDSPLLIKILRLLFSPEEAELARKIPLQLTPLDRLSRKLGIEQDELGEKMTEMARRGLVIDLQHGRRRYFALSPVVIGLFEFTFMRTRDDLPMAELARLFDQYMVRDDRFARSMFRGRTQIGRSLVREEALPETDHSETDHSESDHTESDHTESDHTESDHTEILDWERASHIVSSATALGVSLCACRHKASHLGEACDRPQRCCLTFNYAAESLIRNGIAEAITAAQAMQILEDCKQAGLAQTGDNVQRKVTYICNCCGCCCEMVQAVKTHNLRHAIVTSNWIMEVDAAACKGCGLCARACVVDAIGIVTEEAGENGARPRKRAVCDETLCLGCGVCYSACKSGAISMKPRPKRVLTPETVFDRVVAMAIERGKLTDLIFDQPQRLGLRALAGIVRVIEKTPFFKAAMAIRPLRSVFLGKVVAEGKKQSGEFGEILQ